MESKKSSAKGVQQDDVWFAADALVAEGLRPTIERVRQKIGRGSPNTVSPMLEAWFATLSSRLGVSLAPDESAIVPKALQEAMKKLWDMALSKSNAEADLRIAQAQVTLAQAEDALNTRSDDLARKEQVDAARQLALEDALVAARLGNDDLAARLKQAHTLTNKRETELEALQGKLAAIDAERVAERHRADDAAANHARERQKNEERAQMAQHQLLQEIDKARQEIKKFAVDAQASEKRFALERGVLQEKILFSDNERSRLIALAATRTASMDALREALAVSNARSDELRTLLATQQDSSKSMINRLDLALAGQLEGKASKGKTTVRKIKLPARMR